MPIDLQFTLFPCKSDPLPKAGLSRAVEAFSYRLWGLTHEKLQVEERQDTTSGILYKGCAPIGGPGIRYESCPAQFPPAYLHYLQGIGEHRREQVVRST